MWTLTILLLCSGQPKEQIQDILDTRREVAKRVIQYNPGVWFHVDEFNIDCVFENPKITKTK